MKIVPPKRVDGRFTISGLRLDLDAALAGKTWLLLPEGFRAREHGSTYPLPTRRIELQRLAAIYIPPLKQDSGCFYLRRALKQYRAKQARDNSALLDITRNSGQIKEKQKAYRREMRDLAAEAGVATTEAIQAVKEQADKAIASLTDLFSLGRTGLEAQMQAHLNGQEWQGEKIDAKAFRDCFRMVTQAVKGLGVPSDQRQKAEQAILDEAAAAITATRDAVSLAPGGDQETEH